MRRANFAGTNSADTQSEGGAKQKNRAWGARYGNKVAFVDYNTETAFIVENPVIAEFQKKIFRILYAKL